MGGCPWGPGWGARRGALAPPGIVEHFFGTRKIENVNLRSSRAELSSGTHITHPKVRVPGANGTHARGRRARVRVIFTILRFRE